MEMTKKMQDAFNEQINKELFSEYLYLAMAAYFDAKNLGGMSHWMKKQAGEEHSHAMKLYSFVYDRGGKVILKAIAAPKTEWKNPLDAFNEAYEHEKFITESINKLWDAAFSDKDRASMAFLKWFVDEQVEEEANASEIVEKLKMVGDSKSALFMYDAVLGKRE
ncbi:MAG: ferritin [Nanoarchaeota archaeon]|nr:ferritin [Nanoarchaeota archaeon]